jgi:hypothetical protein
MSAFGDYLAHNIKPRVVCEECRDALSMRTIFPVSGVMVLHDGFECTGILPMRFVALWLFLGYDESGGCSQGYYSLRLGS